MMVVVVGCHLAIVILGFLHDVACALAAHLEDSKEHFKISH